MTQPTPVPSGRVRDITDQLAEALDGRPGAVVLDFGAIDYIGSEDLGALVRLHKRARGAGGKLALVNVRPAVSAVFSVTRLDTVFEVHGSGAKA